VPPTNLHGTAVVLGDSGVLILGHPGSGKTSLALALIASAADRGRFARLVADDQLFIRAANGRPIVEAPATIRGLVEVYGLGPTRWANEDFAVIDLVVRLVEAENAPRFQENGTEKVAGIGCPAISLAERNARAGVAATFAQLRFRGS
jgi:serine kinase of HPr protein (carbohydrate metabolism regulator)